MPRAILLSTLAVCLCILPLAAQQRGNPQQATQTPTRTPSIEERTASMTRLDGFFPLFWDDRSGNLFLEIPRFDTDFLLTAGLAAGLGSNDIGLDRGRQGRRPHRLLPPHRSEDSARSIERILPLL